VAVAGSLQPSEQQSENYVAQVKAEYVELREQHKGRKSNENISLWKKPVKIASIQIENTFSHISRQDLAFKSFKITTWQSWRNISIGRHSSALGS
jgi:hypothetical protein